MSCNSRVVVTGLGVATPLGNGVEMTWGAIRRGESRAGRGAPWQGPWQVGGSVPGQDRLISLAETLAREAVMQAQLRWEYCDLNRVGVTVSASKGGMETFWQTYEQFYREGERAISPRYLDSFFSDRVGAHLAYLYHLGGGRSNPVAACATGLQSVMLGAEWIARGDCDVVLTGSVEASLTPLVLAAFKQMGVLSPSHITRPFHVARDGFVIGEGGAILVLEAESHARERGAPQLGEIAGYHQCLDGYHPVHFDPTAESIVRAGRGACAMAEIELAQIQYVNAHGTGTRLNDQLEARGLHQLFNGVEPPVWVSSLKGGLGHLLGASGSVELALSVQALRDQWLPPTLHLEEPDPVCEIQFVPQGGLSTPVDTILKLSFGFGGHVAALLLRKVSRHD